jgi:hypothetical protein
VEHSTRRDENSMNDLVNLSVFIAWAKDFSKTEEGRRLHAEITISPPSGNPSARLGVCSSSALGITSWSDGSYHAEALDLSTGKSALRSRVLSRITSFFRFFFQVLRSYAR